MNYKNIPTKTLENILNDPYTRGKNGHDYESDRVEIESILWERLATREEKELKEKLKELERIGA